MKRLGILGNNVFLGLISRNSNRCKRVLWNNINLHRGNIDTNFYKFASWVHLNSINNRLLYVFLGISDGNSSDFTGFKNSFGMLVYSKNENAIIILKYWNKSKNK